ncbi:MAG: BadF/BadG/BcrA/BcrD ATPase family protein [Saprospiraceae bacterium]
MQLIADSGSTKTSWRLIKGANDIVEASTIGYNPHYFDTKKMEKSLQSLLIPQLGIAVTEVSQVYFYGAGCSTPSSNAVVEKAFSNVFPEANIYVDHDLLGAARALCGQSTGIACILGTGSNSCAFDGKSITDNVSSLGFMLGDEGSGASLGRRLVRSFFYREMPSDIKESFNERYQMDKDVIFKEVYKSALPSRYMAQFTKFMNEHIEKPFMRNLVKEEFGAFIDTQVLKYENVQSIPINFLGSVAFFFQDIMLEVLEERQLKMGQIIQEPITALVDYHLA